jgi:UDP-glucose 4-epimerase
MRDVTHVIHLARCKETPEDVMDVTVRGLFWLLEEFRTSATAQRFVLIGGDAAVENSFYHHERPITEQTPHMAYPGCNALSKVLEEVMLAQYVIQYGIDACCLRAPWIMEKDDLKYTLSFGDDIFGGPKWKDMVTSAVAARCLREGTVPLLLDAHGRPVKRNFVHVDDLVSAIATAIDHPAARGKTHNICMNEPVDYSEIASYPFTTRGLPSLRIASGYHSNWMDNSAAKFDLNWRPQIDLPKLIALAWDYERPADDPRVTWYPG